MGFLTNISISNDFWHDIQKDPAKLVEAISVLMNYGNSTVGHRLTARRGGTHYGRAPQGLVVHEAQHFDIPQVIVNPYGNYPLDANQINQDWINRGKTNVDQAVSIAKTLRETASRLEEMAKQSTVVKEAS